jgi:hypothetical protein
MKSIRSCQPCHWWCLACLFFIWGCRGEPKLNTEYGKLSNLGRTASINGTRVLAEMFRQRGATVSRQTVLSPRLEKCQTIVWFPNRYIPPEEEITDWLDAWANRGFGRTLIYVGRDFDGDMSYLEQVRDRVAAEDQEELQRLIAETIVGRHLSSNRDREYERTDVCQWFKTECGRRKQVSRIRGPLAQDVETQHCNIELGVRLQPVDERVAERLLITDGHPFVFAVSPSQNPRGKVIVVSNGSFLLNFGLIHPENRKLAENLIGQCDVTQRVVFLESGPGEIRIKNTSDMHQPWAWISRPPLRYIVPHVLFWGVMFCFVFFPIFGRASRFRVKEKAQQVHDTVGLHQTDENESAIHLARSTTSFKSHIAALARMLQRTESASAAKKKVRNYHEIFGRDSTFK